MTKLDNSLYPDWLIADLRTDHAGETGAVAIYNGILAVTRDKDIIKFASRHRLTEQSHLDALEDLLAKHQRTRLLPLWRVAGWITGALPALFGPRAIHATIDAVETFVDEHYQEQIDRLKETGEFTEVKNLLEKCQLDEVEHRDEARALHGSQLKGIVGIWCKLVDSGSRGAVYLSRRF